ncbi:hypothetical protein Aco04nite_31010 [Winogradskya consettensis]|uniref:Uncharacterized protein n=1 Tax=Winogradskya consettensis TaxID=113560 RepID=A0A919VR67_9ACTN|nr:hypothetical protein Aco04nite_31010 [Actinoplanes consettensis]
MGFPSAALRAWASAAEMDAGKIRGEAASAKSSMITSTRVRPVTAATMPIASRIIVRSHRRAMVSTVRGRGMLRD